ncbi:uncharacterized protein LOC124326500 [Daphnia pulicaria]|uniref:uncharacterized protein LOC124326500 n=1 Tax=Daphnia pulicaria TaxID=35523 RepID=UPI001EEA96AC|nr:uncharacterized protein LOC124326500 [Daphnia pulicaria]
MSSPVTGDLSRSTRIGPEGPEFWIQPCGYTVEGNTPPFPDSVLAGDYKSYLEMDLHYLEELWLEQFCLDKFLMSFADQVKSDEAYRYDWLQVNTVIPKNPGQHLNESHYSQLQFPSMLTQSSNIFQRIAIGWEQMEYEKTDSLYKDHFTSAKFRMKNTLCQLDGYLADKKMSPAPNPTRSIMPNELRSITSASQRDERNFRIIKEYVNALEYYIDVFSYFETALASKSSL